MKTKWELKDRTYILSGGHSPITWTIQSRHKAKKPLLYFDEEKQTSRELRYATNQTSCFVDEQDGHVTLGHIVFTDGVLFVPRNQVALQQLMSKYHPRAGELWNELDLAAEAQDEIKDIEIEIEAVNLVRDLDIEAIEAIMRAEIGSTVNDLSSKELKRDAYSFAKKNPELFLELAADEDLQFRNIANRAVEMGVVKLTDDNTVFKWASNDKKIMTVPFDQHPYGAFAQFFKTDEGVQVLKSIKTKLK